MADFDPGLYNIRLDSDNFAVAVEWNRSDSNHSRVYVTVDDETVTLTASEALELKDMLQTIFPEPSDD